MDPDLRPRLRPEALLLRRSNEELQIGLDPGWRLRDRAGRWQRLLSRLDGRRTWGQLAAEDRSIDPVEFARLLDSLVAVGLAEVHPATPGAVVRLVGAGPTGAAIGTRLLDDDPVDRLHVIDVAPERAEGLRRTHPRRVRVERHWTKPDASRVDLTVIVADTVEADRAVAGALLRRDAPHLVVRASSAGAVAGPLVVPGRTACLHCTDLSRRDADPAWPRLLHQLERVTADPVPTVVRDWIVAVAVIQVLGFVAGGLPETLGATLEIAGPGSAMVWRSWPPHPECGCRWAGVVRQ